MTRAVSSEEVERRLRVLPGSLEFSQGDSKALDALLTVHLGDARPPRLRPMRLAAGLAVAACVIAGANAAASYYAPAYGQALAATPVLGGIAQPLLHAFGLTDKNTVALDSSVSSNGHTIHLVAGYADGLRTVIMLEIDGKGLSGNPKQYGLHPGDYGVSLDNLTLTDQFGHTYKPNGANGPIALQFEPLVWPASKVGARLTLHVTALEKQWLLGSGASNPLEPGDWTLHATLMPATVQELPLPAPVSTADGIYTVTRLRFTGAELQIQWTVSGPINDRFDKLVYSSGATANSAAWNAAQRELSQTYFSAGLFDPSGQPVDTLDSGGEWDNGKAFRGTLNLTITHPGRYRLQLAKALTSPADQRWIDVP